MKEEEEIRVWFGIIPCYFNIETYELRGRNFLCSLLLSLYLWIEIKLGNVVEEDEKD
jgi:hypothetical protein